MGLKIAVIPARSGSKRVPRKNVRPINGIPLIGRTIMSILASDVFDEVYVSTNDNEIATIAMNYGASVPFLRAENLADDFTPTQPVISNFLQRLEQEKNIESTYCCCVYATSFLINSRLYKESFERLRTNVDLSYVVTVVEYPHPIQRALEIDTRNNKVRFLEPNHRSTRTQDLPKRFHDAGQLYWGLSSAWRNQIPIFGEKTAGYILKTNSIVDIDNEEDWLRAEKYLTIRENGLKVDNLEK